MDQIELSDGPFIYGFGARRFQRWRYRLGVSAAVVAVVAAVAMLVFGFALVALGTLISAAVCTVAVVVVGLNS